LLESQCVHFGNFEYYKRRFVEMGDFFKLRFEEAGKLGSDGDWSYERRRGEKTLGTLSDCKIMIIKYDVPFSCSICGHRFHEIVILGDKMQYGVLGAYNSPYGKLMIEFVTD